MEQDVKQLSDYNFFDPEVIECPYEFYKLAREQAPVMELPGLMPEAKLFLVTRYDLVMEILKNTEVFSSNFSSLLAGREEQDAELQKIYAQGWPQVNTLLTADPPEHERFRVLVNKAFTASRVKKMHWRVCEGESDYWFYLLVGLMMQLTVLKLFINRFRKIAYR